MEGGAGSRGEEPRPEAERRAALEKVVAIASDPERAFVHDPEIEASFNEHRSKEYAALCALKEQAEARLRRA